MNDSKISWLVALAANLLLAVTVSADQAEISTSIQRALPYLESEGVGWMEKRGCVSCHQIPSMVWSLSAAKEAGFEVDAEKLDQWRKWSTDVVNFVKPEQQENVDHDETMASNIDTMSAMLLAVDDESNQSWRVKFSEALADNQKDDGSWKSCGQLPAQKRSSKETTSVTAAWSLLALHGQGFDEFDSKQAFSVVDAIKKPESAEWLVARLLLADRFGESIEAALRDDLMGRQNDDGGWGWITSEKSDALATGMTVYALSVTGDGDPVTRVALTKAATFLTSTQRDDGSWAVPGTKKSTRKKTPPTANYWGTAWAVIGLLEVDLEAT